jgi:hypothetical protein
MKSQLHFAGYKYGKQIKELPTPGKDVPEKLSIKGKSLKDFSGADYLPLSTELPPVFNLYIWNCYLRTIN